MNLTKGQLDRALGVLSASAVGDALGAGYEFGPPLPETTEIFMKGGGPFGFEPFEWTDDTAMTLIVAKALKSRDSSEGVVSDKELSEIVSEWIRWSKVSKDVGMQTSSVLQTIRRNSHEYSSLSEAAFDSAKTIHKLNGRSGGNGSLMRTSPLALAFLGDEDLLWSETGRVSELTHFDKEASEACQIWAAAIRHAILTGGMNIYAGFEQLDEGRWQIWEKRILDAENSEPSKFENNGWVVEALQAAWASICKADRSSSNTHELLVKSLKNAVRGGRDTDTVAAITGGLIGALCGRSSIPEEWNNGLHGYGATDESVIQSITLDLIS